MIKVKILPDWIKNDDHRVLTTKILYLCLSLKMPSTFATRWVHTEVMLEKGSGHNGSLNFKQ
jgi:hypothetical protein